MKRHGLMLVGCLIALQGMASAGSCVSQTVAALLGTSCSIGDLQFTFAPGDYHSYGTDSTNQAEYAATAVNFAPVLGGFELSGPFSSSGGGDTYGFGALYYTVSVTDGTLTGVTTNLNSSSLSVSPGPYAAPGPNQYSYSEAFNFSGNELASGGNALTEPYLSQNYGSTPFSTTYGNGGSAALSPAYFETGVAVIQTYVSNRNCSGSTCTNGTNTASASFASADFGFQVSPTATPEPSAWLLLATIGALTILPIRRLRRRE